MDLKATILQNHTKQKMHEIVCWVGSNQQKFDALFAFFIGTEKELIQKSGWPLSYCVQKHPNLLDKHYPVLMQKLQDPQNTHTFKRDCMRLLQFVKIPIAYEGIVLNVCFIIIQNTNEKPATKAFAMHNLISFAHKYPDIKPELIIIIESQWQHESMAFKSVAKKILAEHAK